MGPRRVGKTVMLLQTIQQLISEKISAKNKILYVAVDTPTYTDCPLETLLNWFRDIHNHDAEEELFIFFDEIQYHPDWERHLKSLVDSYPDCRFVVSGSAAAALKMKSQESGAGRFTDFLLPPLNFREFLEFTGKIVLLEPDTLFQDIGAANEAFLEYINYGGFPEAAIKEGVRQAYERYIANDIIDKVLLRDLPSLYGVSDTQELKRFFTTLAYNTGQELSYEELSKNSGVAKNTIRKYLEYLEASFLIHRVHRLDRNGKRFRRVTHFKVYLTNPSLRAALFGPISDQDPLIGALVETAIFAQYAATSFANNTYYARWAGGEVDLVVTVPPAHVMTACEIKWSDRVEREPKKILHALVSFCKANKSPHAIVLTKTTLKSRDIDGVSISFFPAALEAYVNAKTMVDGPIAEGFDPLTLRRLRPETSQQRFMTLARGLTGKST